MAEWKGGQEDTTTLLEKIGKRLAVRAILGFILSLIVLAGIIHFT